MRGPRERDGETGTPCGEALRFDGGRLEPVPAKVPAEVPLRIVVNGREAATLLCSPRRRDALAVGFLRMQGWIATREDLRSLRVEESSGTAHATIRGDLPERLSPVLTSGCGGGIDFRLPGAGGGEGTTAAPDEIPAGDRDGERPGRRVSPEEIFRTLEATARLATGYRETGGLHSAAARIGPDLLLHAEDIGRHNTLDRIAGEALLRGIELAGAILATSGRISSEMAAKAAALGVGLVASRTSPTDQAVRICRERGITLVGYVRGRTFTVYAHPWRISGTPDGPRIPGVTGVILAGGSSRRMGSDKALLPYRGGRLIEAIHRQLAGLFKEVLVVTNAPDAYGFLPCRKVPDLLPGMGALSGIHSGLVHSPTPRIFAVACDMPHLSPGLIRSLVERAADHDAVVPESDAGIEPLHAVYHRNAVPAIEEALRAGEARIAALLGKVRSHTVPRDEVARIDPGFRSFVNLNTPDDYSSLREEPGEGVGRAARGNRADGGRPDR